jgi:hypothetical protein
MLFFNPIKYCMHLQQMHSFQKKKKKRRNALNAHGSCCNSLGYLFLLQDPMILLYWVLEQELEPKKLKSLQIEKAQFFGF